MKRSPAATVRRTLRRGVTWRPKSVGRSPVLIAELISPLRYDVLVRAQFFEFLSVHDPDGTHDAAELALLAREHPYFTWFEKVAMARFRPWVLKDRELLHQQYAERVALSSALWQSFQARGFDPDRPVTLRVTRSPTLTDSGFLSLPRLHVGDGGHRLALLLAGGDGRLEPNMYRVDPRRMRTLIDNTVLLLPELELSSEAYAAFLAGGYGAPRELTDVAAVVGYVREQRPGSLAELERVLEVHRRASECAA